MVPGHVPGLLHVHLPSGEVALVPHHHHRHLLCVLDPLDLLPVGRDVLERLDVVDGEYDEESLPGPHVLVPHGTILLLTSGVENIQEARLSIYHHLLPVAVLDGRVVLVNEVVLDELYGQGGLAHATGSDYHELVLRHVGGGAAADRVLL